MNNKWSASAQFERPFQAVADSSMVGKWPGAHLSPPIITFFWPNALEQRSTYFLFRVGWQIENEHWDERQAAARYEQTERVVERLAA